MQEQVNQTNALKEKLAVLVEDRLKALQSSLRDEMYLSTVPDPEMLFGEIVPLGMLTLLYGREGSQKSMIGYDAGRACATGDPFLGKFETKYPGGVLFISQDTSEEDAAKCLRKTLAASTLGAPSRYGVDALFHEGITFYGANGTINARAVATICRERKKRLVVIDSASKTFFGQKPGGEADINNINDASSYIGNLRLLIAETKSPENPHGVAVIVICHPPKNGDTILGSAGFGHQGDVIMKCEVKAPGSRDTHIYFEKFRGPFPPNGFVVTRAGDGSKESEVITMRCSEVAGSELNCRPSPLKKNGAASVNGDLEKLASLLSPEGINTAVLEKRAEEAGIKQRRFRDLKPLLTNWKGVHVQTEGNATLWSLPLNGNGGQPL